MTEYVKKTAINTTKKRPGKNIRTKEYVHNEADDQFEDYFNAGKMSYLKEQRERLKKMNGEDDE